MSHICDICGEAACEYMKVTAWWGKHLAYSDPSGRYNRWSAKLRQDTNQLTANICRKCVEQGLSKFINFNQELSEELLRKRAIESRRKKYPNESMLKSLRMTVPGGVEDIHCEICLNSCFEKHLKLQSEWQYPDQSTLTGYLCEECVSKNLIGQVKFQPLPIINTVSISSSA